jgi:hypothetical protein
MFPSRPACHCQGTLTAMVRDKANGTPFIADRTEFSAPDVKSNDLECVNGQLACATNGQDLYICINHVWNLRRHCTSCKTDNNGHVACMGNGLPAPLIEDISKVVARAEFPSPDTTPTNSICVEYQQKCGDNGKDKFICRDGAWTFQSQCDTCKEDNGIFTCFSKITPLPSNRPTSTASINWLTQATSVTLTPAPTAPTSGVDEASALIHAGSCISGHIKCNRDGYTMDKCKRQSWVFWDNCSRFGRGRCIPDGDTAYCEGPLVGGLVDTAPALIPRTAGSEALVSPAPASIPPPELICTDGQLRCTSDYTSIEKCKNRSWKLDRKCSNEFGSHCVFYRNTAHCGYTNEAADLVARVPALEENTDSSETSVRAAPTSGVDGTSAIAPPPFIPICGGGDLKCGSDGESVEICSKGRFVFAYSCRSVSHNEYHSRCISGPDYRSTHCSSIHERVTVVPAPVQEKRDDSVFSPHSPEPLSRTIVGNEQGSSSGDIVTHTRNSDECTNGEKKCSVDRQHVIICENGHWKDQQYCGPAGCDYKRPSYEPYCPYPSTTSTLDGREPVDAEVISARSTNIVTANECTEGEQLCSADHQYLLVCVHGHWMHLQYCGPAGCQYQRPSYKPYCPYPPTLRAISTADKVAARNAEPATVNLLGN